MYYDRQIVIWVILVIDTIVCLLSITGKKTNVSFMGENPLKAQQNWIG